MKKSKNKILFWDFQTRVENGKIFLTPIPMSYAGKMKITELEKLNNYSTISPIFSGDGKVIYVHSAILALNFLKKGHKLLPEFKKEFMLDIN